ncbi:VanW family protein [Clostridium oryzae]|uniref:Vancomycin B-type resistance protein VanW n=1 Tax=Clostridium oryzae TaxID=1450648 RepID=A0A1V4IVX4_9CLOT|nr:VanW family protein [Clostridium oryzae]OPJ63980.1 vancomycin B-type resistance protein VanW [Clostridium oryzae]
MVRGSYRITISAKIIILQILLFSLGAMCGLTWEICRYNKKWDSLLYRRLEVNDLHLRGRSVKEDKALIKSRYIDPLMKRDIKIITDDKSYKLHISKIVRKYSIESKIDKLEQLNGQPTIYEKIKLIKKGINQIYSVNFIYNEDYIDSFVNRIEKDINAEPVNANIVEKGHGSIEINPDINGRKLDKEKLEKELKEEVRSKNTKNMIIRAHTIEYTAPITVNKLSVINTRIASFTTDFSSSPDGRCRNIELSSKSINGRLIMPGQNFSFNAAVGKRTTERGYRTAPVLADGRVDSGIGGGICQVSSTLYNAILRSGIKPFEREHHTIPSSYVKLGLDATVSWNDIDFKFKNTLRYPIYVEAHTENKKLQINIYSNSSLLKRKYVILNNVYKVIPCLTKNIKDPRLPKGKIVFVQAGHDGYAVKVKRDVYENNKLVKCETISNDMYTEIPRIQKIGSRD